MSHPSITTKLRTRLVEVAERLASLIGELPVRRFTSDHVVFVGPQFFFGERTRNQKARQLQLKREYDQISELLGVLVGGCPKQLVDDMQKADKDLREWIDFDGSWSVTANTQHNAQKARVAVEPIQKILAILEEASKSEVFVIPDTNSLLFEANPTAYRELVQGQFTFALLATVLGELDKLKVEHRNPNVREKARKVVSRIKGWRNQGSLAMGVTVDKTITVKAFAKEPQFQNTLSWLDPANDDDRIIASVLALQAEFPAARVVLVSGDINLLNKADVALIENAEPPRTATTRT